MALLTPVKSPSHLLVALVVLTAGAACSLQHPARGDGSVADAREAADTMDVALDTAVVEAAVDVPPPLDRADAMGGDDADAPDVPAMPEVADTLDVSDVADVPDVLDVRDAADRPDVSDVTVAGDRADVADAACPTGRTRCDGLCADTQIDLQHCGGCGRRCADGQTCTFGRCVCQQGAADCDGNAANGCEVDTTTSAAHCGGCGMACTARANSTPACVAGRCTPECATGFADCDTMEANGCEVNTATELSHCGGCGAVCQMRPNAATTCAMGRCVFACSAGFGDCDATEANGCEVSLQTTSTHCGRCGNACMSGRACTGGTCDTAASCMPPRLNCSSVCIDPQTDARNCGACNRVCAMGQTCVAGTCQCPPTLSSCPAGCTNLSNDRANCGMCGRQCAVGATCVGGSCTCPSDQRDCGGRCVNTSNDIAHCGMCGRACAVSGACVGGNCICGARGQACCWFGRCGAGLRCSWGACE